MSNFKYPIRVDNISKEQYSEIVPKLQSLGYIVENQSYTRESCLITNKAGVSNKYGLWDKIRVNAYLDSTRTIIKDYNKDLILALCAAREGYEYYPEEYVVALENYPYAFTKGRIYTVKNYDNSNESVYTFFDDKKSTTNSWYKRNFRKATKEEIIAHFTKTIPIQEVDITKWKVKVENIIQSADIARYINAKVGTLVLNGNGTKGVVYSFDEISKSFSSTTDPYNYLNLSFEVWQEKILNKSQNNNLTIKINENEESSKAIEVPRVTSTVTAGERYTGSTVSGKYCKSEIAVGYLSYSTVTS